MQFNFNARGAALTACCLALFIGASQSAQAEVFVLGEGRQLEGELVNADESPREKYVVRLPSGVVVTLARAQVQEVVRRRPAEIEYEAIRHNYPDTVEGQWELAEWCREQHLSQLRKVHLERILQLDPDHLLSRRALGFARVGDEWKTQEEIMTERGYVLYKGRWRLPQEMELLEQRRQAEVAVKAWFRDLKRYRGMIGTPRGEEAAAAIRSIEDPQAVPALRFFLQEENVDVLRELYLEALSQIGTPQAIEALALCSLEDSNDEVRLTCLDYLKRMNVPEVAGFYVERLRAKDNAMVNRAALALETLGQTAAVPALIESLVTAHKYKVVTGGGQYNATFNPSGGGGGGFSSGGGPQIITKQLQNPEVLNALVTLTGVDFGYDLLAWRAWLAANRAPVDVDGRRD